MARSAQAHKSKVSFELFGALYMYISGLRLLYFAPKRERLSLTT